MAAAARKCRLVALYLLWRYIKSKRCARRRLRVEQIIQRRYQLGESHQLVQELQVDDEQFQRYFRLTRRQFDDLLRRIGDRITHQNTNYRRPISAAKRLSICLRYLATGDSFRAIASSFRIGRSTVHKIVPEVASAIWDCLEGEFMALPSTDDWRSIARDFQERWNFPLCCGALDGKHVVLKSPPHSESLLYDHKGNFSLILLAVVDANYCFRLIDVGGYERSSDGGILANSSFGQALRGGSLHLPADRPLPGADDRGPQPHVFVADEAFPLRRNLLRPYPGRTLPQEQNIFNYRLSRARLVVENAFGILSSQWGVYRHVIEVHPEVVEKCVKATCVLHNFLRRSADEEQPVVVESVSACERLSLTGLGRVAANNHSRAAIRVRETFTEYFSAEGTVPWQQNMV